MRCVIIGGGGFIGSHLSEALLTSGHEVTVFDRPEARYLEYSHRQGASLLYRGLLNPDDISRAVSGSDVVYHLASTTVPKTSNDILPTMSKQISWEPCDCSKWRGKNRSRRLFSHPLAVPFMGFRKESLFKEDHPTEPISSYGICKLTIEKYLNLYWKLHGLDYCILRISNAFGERQPVTETQGAISAFLDGAINHRELVVWGDGSIMRDYIYIEDIANALIKAGTYEGEPKIFNIGAGQGHSLNDIIGIIEHLLQRPLHPKYVSGRSFDVPINVLDISRASTYLNWQPGVGLLEGVSRSLEWMLKEQNE